jgi:hypothetical protein
MIKIIEKIIKIVQPKVLHMKEYDQSEMKSHIECTTY